MLGNKCKRWPEEEHNHLREEKTNWIRFQAYNVKKNETSNDGFMSTSEYRFFIELLKTDFLIIEFLKKINQIIENFPLLGCE
jgi:hypothetical protein